MPPTPNFADPNSPDPNSPDPSSTAPVPIQLTPLRHDQIEQALLLDRLCWGNIWSADGYDREIDSDRSDLLLLTHATATESPPIGLGCLWAILNEGHITLLGIHPQYQGQGLGSWLLVQLLRAACDRALDSATLEVRVSNESALRLYNRFGFQQVGRRRAYYQDTGEDGLILCRHSLQQVKSVQQLDLEQRAVTDRLRHTRWYPLP